jgi:hypothetical protein
MAESFYPVTEISMAPKEVVMNHYQSNRDLENFTKIRKEFMSPQQPPQRTVFVTQNQSTVTQNQSYFPKSENKVKQDHYETIDNKYGMIVKRTRTKNESSVNQSVVSISHDAQARDYSSLFQSFKTNDNFLPETQNKILTFEHAQNHKVSVTHQNRYTYDSNNLPDTSQQSIESQNNLTEHPNEFNYDFDKGKRASDERVPGELNINDAIFHNQNQSVERNFGYSMTPTHTNISNSKITTKEDTAVTRDIKIVNFATQAITDNVISQQVKEWNGHSYSSQNLEKCQSTMYQKVKLVFEGLGSYEGGFRNGKLDGYGILSGIDNAILYEGEFDCNQFNGVGVMYNEPQGSDLDSVFEGRLPACWIRYEGLFCKNKREGFGELFFKDGSQYSGEFLNDTSNGFGTYVTKFGDKIAGVWKNNTLESQV